MFKTRLVLLFFIFLFFFSFAINVDGYEIFNQNPYFNNYTDYNGTNIPTANVLLQSAYNSSWYYNETCAGLTNCTIIEGNGTGQGNILYIQKYDWLYTGLNPSWINATALQEFHTNNAQNGVNYLYTYLPSNEEGIIILKYRWNTTLTTPAPYLSTIDNLGNSLNYTVLNSTPNVWHNLSVIISPSLSNRYLKVSVGWFFDNLVSMAMFDTFKFYTLDVQSTYDSSWATRDSEALKYCGVGYSVCGNDWFCFRTYTFTNTSSNTRQMFLCSDVENFNVSVLNYQNYYSQARRVLSHSSNFVVSQGCDIEQTSSEGWYSDGLIQTRDYFIIQNVIYYSWGAGSTACADAEKFVIESNNLLEQKITALKGNPYYILDAGLQPNNSAIASHTVTMYYNGTPQTAISFVNSTIASSLFGTHNSSFKETINVLPYSSSQSPSGSGWKVRFLRVGNDMNSSTFPFFSESTYLCTPHSVCNPSTNNQTYINSDCSQSEPVYCDLCGCNANGTYCNYPTQIGSVCDLSDPSHLGFTVYYSNCTTIYKSCNQNEVCNQETSQFGVNATLNYTTLNTVCCYKQGTATINYCFDEYGNNITYDQLITNISSSVSSSQSTDILVNPMNAVASLIGGAFGYGTQATLPTAQLISSLLISLCISIFLIFTVISKSEQKINSNNLTFLFSFTLLALLVMFTFIGWFPSWLMIVLIVISAVAFIKIGGIGGG